MFVDYHDGKTLLSEADLISGMEQPYEMKSDGVVFWGSSTELNNQTFLNVSYAHHATCDMQHATTCTILE